MRQYDINAKKFHKGHYEIIAARFREALDPYMSENGSELHTEEGEIARKVLVDFAIRLATRFQADNEDFSPEMFLARCSPNHDRFPLEELWIIAEG